MTMDRRFVVAWLVVPSTLLLCAPAARAQDADACIAASESSLAQRKAGKLIDARKSLAACAAPACPDPIRSSCSQRLADIERAVPSVVFQVKDTKGNDVPGVRITLDGQARTERAGTAITLDPGEHTFTFEADGQPSAKKTLVIVEGVKERSETVMLGTPSTAPAPAAPGAAADSGSRQRTLGLIVGGVGVGGLAVGTIFGLMASSSWSTAQSEQKNSQYPQDRNDQQNASTYATVSTVAFVVGGLAVAAGAVIWLTGPSASAPAVGLAPSLEPGGGGALLQGAF